MELTPKTRKETFLAAAGGQNVSTPTPVTREEVFLDAIAKGGGGGGGTGGGVLVVHQTVTTSGEDTIYTLDKTFEELMDAGFSVLHVDNGGYVEIRQMSGFVTEAFYVQFGNNEYVAESASGYPSYTESGK